MEFVAANLRLEWDPERRILRAWRKPMAGASREQNEAAGRFIRNVLGEERSHSVVMSWEGEGPTSLADKAFWRAFYASYPPRKFAAVRPTEEARRAVETLGLLAGFETRAFEREEDAIVWAAQP